MSELNSQQIYEMWCNSEDDIIIEPSGRAFLSESTVAEPADGNPDFKAIQRWMEDNNYFPNVWQVNDHGNVALYSIDEKGHETFLGDIV